MNSKNLSHNCWGSVPVSNNSPTLIQRYTSPSFKRRRKNLYLFFYLIWDLKSPFFNLGQTGWQVSTTVKNQRGTRKRDFLSCCLQQSVDLEETHFHHPTTWKVQQPNEQQIYVCSSWTPKGYIFKLQWVLQHKYWNLTVPRELSKIHGLWIRTIL